MRDLVLLLIAALGAVALLVVDGCAHQPPAPPRPPVDLAQVADVLDAAAGVLEVAVPAATWETCVAREAAVSGCRLAAGAVRAALEPAIPGVELDVGPCLLLRPGEDQVAVAPEVGATIAAAGHLVRVGLAAAPLPCASRAWLEASLVYVGGAAHKVAAYVADPTRGPLLLDPVAVDLVGCEVAP